MSNSKLVLSGMAALKFFTVEAEAKDASDALNQEKPSADHILTVATSTDGYSYFSVPHAALTPQKVEPFKPEQDQVELDTGWTKIPSEILKKRKDEA